MEIENKYNHLKNNLKNLEPQSTMNQLESAGCYYFKTLSEISMDILLEQNEINVMTNKLEFMKSKYNVMSAKYAQRKRKQEQKRIIHCEHEDCKLAFIKDKQLHYHKLFEHENENLFTNNGYSFKVGQDDKE